MDKLLKNVEPAESFSVKDKVEYEEGKVVSLTLAQQPGVSMTLFALDEGESIGGHAAPGDAFVLILDGEAKITIDGKTHTVTAGNVIVMPAGVHHALKAEKRFKMMLTVVKKAQ